MDRVWGQGLEPGQGEIRKEKKIFLNKIYERGPQSMWSSVEVLILQCPREEPLLYEASPAIKCHFNSHSCSMGFLCCSIEFLSCSIGFLCCSIGFLSCSIGFLVETFLVRPPVQCTEGKPQSHLPLEEYGQRKRSEPVKLVSSLFVCLFDCWFY